LFVAAFAALYSNQFSLFDVKLLLLDYHPLVMIIAAQNTALFNRLFLECQDFSHGIQYA
jgi:hypothetical protein